MCNFSQALKTGISFSKLFEKNTFSGRIKRPFACITKFNIVLLAEPYENKIGLYNARTLNFLSWMVHPDTSKGTRFEFPFCFFIMMNGNIIILEASQMNICDVNFVPIQQPIPGKFLSLSEEANGSILATQIQGLGTDNKLSVKKLTPVGGKYH